ncbi:MAG TPA: flavin reductase family protein [Candidatus Tectomicrobia bacterium]|nr:flavin reductase family protein [Candidatus Tectomicrobia bacterium]
MIAPDDFRRVLAHFASGITVLTTCDADQRPTGLTATAFSSVSLEPPLVLVCVDHKSQSYPALRERGRFAVNILRADQEAVSRRFATTRLDKFEGLSYRLGALGMPLIDGALAHLECAVVNAHVEGDHTIFIGRVEHAGADDGDPLLYYCGRYARLAPATRGA